MRALSLLLYSAACVSPDLLHAQSLDSTHREETPPFPAEQTSGDRKEERKEKKRERRKRSIREEENRNRNIGLYGGEQGFSQDLNIHS